MSQQVSRRNTVSDSLEEVVQRFWNLLISLSGICRLSRLFILSVVAVLTASASTGPAAQSFASCVVKRLLQHQQLACAVLFEGFEQLQFGNAGCSEVSGLGAGICRGEDHVKL